VATERVIALTGQQMEEGALRTEIGQVVHYTSATVPTPATFGVGYVTIDGVQYWSNGSVFTKNRAEDCTDQVMNSVIEEDISSISTVINNTTIDARSRDEVFSGWGAYFNTQAGIDFNVITLPTILQGAAVIEAERWAKLYIVVKDVDKDGTIVAQGEVTLPTPYSRTHSDVSIVLRDPVTSDLKTLNSSNLSATYFVGYYAESASGGFAVSGEMTGEMPNFAGETWYTLSADPYIWDAFTANPSIALRHDYIPELIQAEVFSIKPEYLISEPPADTRDTLTLSPTIYAIEGAELNIYFDSMTQREQEEFRWNVSCSQGLQQNERFTTGLAAVAGDYALTITNIEATTGNDLNTSTATLKVASSSNGTGLNKTCLFIGDSTTAAGKYTQELVNLFTIDSMDITLIGTIGSGANLHEGHSGWTANNFVSSGSPFYFGGAFDFAQYLSTNGLATPDYVFINLGINDVFSYYDDVALEARITDVMAEYEEMIANIHAHLATINIGIAITIPPSKHQDAFGSNYSNDQTRERYKRNIIIFADNIISTFKDREGTNIYLVPINTNLDTANNMSTVSVAVNSRNPTPVTRQSNGVHPATYGYEQIADVFHAALKNLL